MRVSFCVIARNEQTYLTKLFSDICNQTYDHSKIEVILVDSESNDNTRILMEEFKKHNCGFYDVMILDNPMQILAAGWNLAIKHSTGDVIVRLDAHASMPKDFIQKNMEYIMGQDEDVTGGARPNIADDSSDWAKTLLIVESSMFGSSIAPYRKSNGEKNVKSLFHAAYRREIFEMVGGFNEHLGRTEDNEIHYRIRKAGYKLSYHPDIVSYQHTRSNLKKMLKQKFANGYWVGLTLGVCPQCLSLYHFIPSCFVLGIMITTLQVVLGNPIFSKLLWGLYIFVTILMSLLSLDKKNLNFTLFALPFLFFYCM